jgi:hypothetical protein
LWPSVSWDPAEFGLRCFLQNEESSRISELDEASNVTGTV